VYFVLQLIHIWKLLALFWLHQLDPSLILLLICHIPRYVTSKCCNDPSHIENYNSSDYEDELLECQDQHRCILSGWGMAMGLNFEICDPTAVVNNTEPLLRLRTTSSGGPLWSMADGVHMTKETYSDLALEILEAAHGCDMGDNTSCSSGSSKRKCPELVVTVPSDRPPKHSRPARPLRPAGWLRGILEQDSPASRDNWRGGSVRGAWRRGRPGASYSWRRTLARVYGD
jgi:hypothetical protein